MVRRQFGTLKDWAIFRDTLRKNKEWQYADLVRDYLTMEYGQKIIDTENNCTFVEADKQEQEKAKRRLLLPTTSDILSKT